MIQGHVNMNVQVRAAVTRTTSLIAGALVDDVVPVTKRGPAQVSPQIAED